MDLKRWELILEYLKPFAVLDDRSTFKVPGRLPLLDFIQIPKPEKSSDPPGLGYYCTFPGCDAASLYKKSIKNHIYDCHRDRGGRSSSQLWERGYVQRLFSNGSGKQYLRVNPLLKTVTSGSAFDQWYSTFRESGGPWQTVRLHSAKLPENLNGFLTKAGWLTQIQGYSVSSLTRLISIPKLCLSSSADPLYRIRDTAIAYLRSITPQDLGTVYPSNLRQLNHWKKHQYDFFVALLDVHHLRTYLQAGLHASDHGTVRACIWYSSQQALFPRLARCTKRDCGALWCHQGNR